MNPEEEIIYEDKDYVVTKVESNRVGPNNLSCHFATYNGVSKHHQDIAFHVEEYVYAGLFDSYLADKDLLRAYIFSKDFAAISEALDYLANEVANLNG